MLATYKILSPQMVKLVKDTLEAGVGEPDIKKSEADIAELETDVGQPDVQKMQLSSRQLELTDSSAVLDYKLERLVGKH